VTLTQNTPATLDVSPGVRPPLDPAFLPAVLWNRAYRAEVARCPDSLDLAIALVRPDGICFRHDDRILPHQGGNVDLNRKYVERLVKFLLWQKGGSRILVGGCPPVADLLAGIYSAGGERAFDVDIVGRKMFLEPITVAACSLEEIPEERAPAVALGRHLDGCRIGFDLGGSDRKCAAVVDGRVVFSEEVAWNPYFEKDPQYHLGGIRETLQHAAAHLPRVDAIGGSAAGVYVNNEVRIASLFRGIAEEDFEKHIRKMFLTLREEWNHIPFDVINDGEVTALAGAMALNANALLGVSMGTSQAAGYCDADGHITAWLNELAFAPIDYRDDAPADEWSGDVGCGVQYFSQQGVARLAPLAGIELPPGMPPAERLVEVQKLMAAGDERAAQVYTTIGICFGYAIAHYADFYDFRHLLVLGRVTSGSGGEMIIAKAGEVLAAEFPELAGRVRMTTPDEKEKRHGQAIAAASLPALGRTSS
jgi:predicted NBD/HSP70 family sugar kinase